MRVHAEPCRKKACHHCLGLVFLLYKRLLFRPLAAILKYRN
jgi:hypothetical protein